MEINTHINKSNPLHLYGYTIEDNNLILKIVNKNNELIDSVEIKFFEDVYNCEVNSSSEVFDIVVKIKNSHFIDKPIINSCVIKGKTIVFDYSSEEYMTKASSISKLGRERYLYAQKMSKKLNRDKKQIKFIADQIEDAWHCTCGTHNFNSQSKCINCGINKNDLFDEPVDLSKESNKTRHQVIATRILLTYLVIISLVQIIFFSILFGGDVLYANQTVNTFFAVFNRVISPVLICLITLGHLRALNRYNNLMKYTLEGIRSVLILYLNIIMFSKFVLTSYNFVMTMAFDLAFVSYYTYLVINKQKEIQNYAVSSFCAVSLIVGTIFPIALSKYSIVMKQDGISLTVVSNESSYTVPETINGEKVVELIFEEGRDYSNIETLNISKNLQRVITSTMRTPNLAKINLAEGNDNLVIHNNLLMDALSNKVYLIPAQLEEITVDWDKVLQRTFYEAKNLKVVNFTPNVKMIDDEAFAYCTSLTDVNFVEGLDSLGEDTFAYCTSLVEFNLPDSLTYIERGTLRGCTNIKKISFPFLGAKRYDEYISTNPNVLAYHMGATYNMGNIADLDLEEVNITSQNFLQSAAFYRCNAETINISIQSGNLETNDFLGCSITSFTVPDGVEYIGESCFQYCDKLTEITLPSTLKEIKANAFAGCTSLTKVNFEGDKDSLTIASGNDIIVSLLN